MPQQLLEDGLKQLGFDPDGLQTEQFHRYFGELELWNPTHGLVNARGADLVVRHLLDCAAGAPVLKRQIGTSAVVADVGSGAGLPGIPLAILMPEQRFVLIERSARRAGFLRNVVAACRLANATVCEQQVRATDERFEAITYRAFHPLTPELLDDLRRILNPGGLVAAYKGSRVRAIGEIEWLPGDVIAELVPLLVPGLDEERHMLLLRFNSNR
jgi:16S rRNA (guanine527-N7)-methyltransferase